MANLEKDLSLSLDATAQFSAPIFCSYRYTFEDQKWTNEQYISKGKDFVRYIREHYSMNKMTWGIENHTKGMIKCKAHIHIHFVTKHKPASIRKTLGRYFNIIGRHQCCKPQVLVDEDKFFRYPLKQQKNDSYIGYNGVGFPVTQLNEMRDRANDEWILSAEIFQGKLEKKLERSTKDRLFTYLSTLDFVDEETLVKKSYEYFVLNEDNFNVNTVNGYIHIYLLANGLKTYQSFYEKYYKK